MKSAFRVSSVSYRFCVDPRWWESSRTCLKVSFPAGHLQHLRKGNDKMKGFLFFFFFFFFAVFLKLIKISKLIENEGEKLYSKTEQLLTAAKTKPISDDTLKQKCRSELTTCTYSNPSVLFRIYPLHTSQNISAIYAVPVQLLVIRYVKSP